MSKNVFIIILSILTASVVALNTTFPVHALSTTPTNTLLERQENRASKAAERQSDMLSRIIQRADELISTRLDSLQKLLTRVQSDKRLSDTDKTSLTSDIQTTVGALQTLKTKIDADTDVATTRADAKSIITTYKVYAIFEPKIRLLTTISNLQTSSENVSSLSARIQTLLTTLKSEGKDTSAAQAALTDITTQLTTINTTLATDKALVANVNTNTTNPQSVFVQVRKDLAAVRNEFATIRKDIATIRVTIKQFEKMSPSPASSSAK